MKLFALFATLCAIHHSNSTAEARDFAAIQKSGTLIAASEGAFKPFNFFEGKKLTGFEIDLVETLAKSLGLKVEWKTLGFDALLIGLNQDRYDLVAASHGITPERLKAVDFSDPSYCTGGIVVSKDGGPKNAAELKGKKVAVQVGTTYLQNVQKVAGIGEVKTYPKDTDALQAIMQNKVDAWVTDKFSAMDLIQSNKAAKLNLHELLFQERIGIAVSKGNSSLLAKLNAALKTAQKDGSYSTLSKKYFGTEVGCK